MAQLVKNPPAMQETWVPSLDWEDPLEKGKATHSSILAWRIPWTVYVYCILDSNSVLYFVFFLCNAMFSFREGNAPHSSTLAWKIPWTEEPGRLQSMGSQRVRHN